MELLWTLILSAVGLLIILRKWFRHIPNLPPGPRKIPVLGNLHQMGSEPHKTFVEMGVIYGDVFSFQFGSYPGVVLNGHRTIKEALSLSAFNGRHQETVAFPREGGIGLSEGNDWAEQRRFALKTLRDFGFGKKSAESSIMTEVLGLIERIKSTVGTPNDFMLAFNAAVLNSLWSMLTGGTFAHDDPRLLDIVSLLSQASIQANGLPLMVKLSFFISWMKPLRTFIPLSRQLLEFVTKALNMMTNIVEEHKQYPPSIEAGDYIDAYLKEISNTKDPSSSFWGRKGEKNLPVALFDLFLGGTETTASTLAYALQYLALHAEIQDKFFAEIKEIIGTTRLPELVDRAKMNYAEAVILEILRHSALIPRSLPHRTTETVQFKGYTIPKDWIVVPNLYSALYDPKEWDQPEIFNPDRFLTAEGVVSKHHEALIPFSVGKRICPGESLARDQLFLFLCSLVQRFKFKQDPNSPPLKIEYSVTPLILTPVPKPLIVEERV